MKIYKGDLNPPYKGQTFRSNALENLIISLGADAIFKNIEKWCKELEEKKAINLEGYDFKISYLNDGVYLIAESEEKTILVVNP